MTDQDRAIMVRPATRALWELAPNLHYGFTEAGPTPAERIRAAADAGFGYVELLWLEDDHIPALATALGETGVRLWNLATEPFFVLAREDDHEAMLSSFRRHAQYAETLGCPHIVIPSGVGLPYLKRPVQLDTVAKAVDKAAHIAADHGLTILLEAANTRYDHAGSLCCRTEDSATIVRQLDTPLVRLQYDMYHSIVEGEDPATVLPENVDITTHLQVGDVPFRPEPGAGELDWDGVFDLIESVGYSGVIGIECYPTKPSAEAFTWIQEFVSNRAGSTTPPTAGSAPETTTKETTP